MEDLVGKQLSFKEKQAERMKRLRDLHIKRNEARQMNHKEVLEEDKRSKLPSNWEARKRQREWVLNDEEKRREAEEKGEDYDRVKLLHIEAVEAERLDRKKKKKNPDTGFADYDQATARQYNRLVKSIKPDMEQYECQKQKLGEAFYGGQNAILHGLQKDTKEGIDRMVQDLEKQVAKREKYSRRRMHNDDADIDYINERNMKFNKKLERFYGAHTTEIKQNLERGTAV
ncbi:pre-mRNA-splicing factor SYF2 [Zootermopsis nevadensis]|uniref:Pre-mRNA-splicing factor SYF2 n=1 Tax=Zootermopsis nevadensis TaxID=136037 RepID=A0A067QM59_ZOONE|nr:pre-mRNA-splicing factor SYF2 [Zootermopsis nevadensis]XP_021936803.1 pre-mRNA-splicing factor SYF2 [Zootermopsis nevadensis]XP_021936804.1 pre-mRNA-splicing factor SYF2 [Zootermopsis nevadensis]KDR10190.1 Pre-mRNA-splicing factor syf2 [Zootermopsis nevadensis]